MDFFDEPDDQAISDAALRAQTLQLHYIAVRATDLAAIRELIRDQCYAAATARLDRLIRSGDLPFSSTTTDQGTSQPPNTYLLPPSI